MWQDLKFGLKLVWKEKAFTLTALLTLALCIGANTAIFSVLDAVILNPLPFPESARLVMLYNIYPGVGVRDRGANAIPDYLDRRKMAAVFEEVALVGGSGYDVGAQGSPQRINGEQVTPSYFRALRIAPMLGRAFTEEEAVLGNEKVAVLSHGLWKEMFASDPKVAGKDIRLSGVPYRIVGVMPEGFARLRRDSRVWIPFAFTPQQTSDDARHSNNWGMIARLKPGVALALAQQRIDALNKANLERFPKYRKLLEDAGFATVVRTFKDELVRDVRPTLYLLQAAVVLVLLIGCVNVANLMLVRSNVRMKELAIRFSLGASRLRLGRQLLTESVLLAVLGGALGVFVGYAGVRLLATLGARDLPRGADIQIDGGVLAFSAVIAVLTGLVFGSVPVLHLFRRNLNDAFRQTERTGTTEQRAIWTRSALVVSQVALAFVLLIGSGLLTLSFSKLLSVDPGFRSDNVLTAQLALPRSRYAEDPRARTFLGGLLGHIRTTPGVAHVGITTYLPFSGRQNASVIGIEGYQRAPGENPPVPGFNTVSPGYFQAIGVPLLQGRTFAESDAAEAQRVVVIDQFLARKYWPKGDAIGARIRRGVDGTDQPWTIVGVVRSVKVGDLAEQNPVGQVYYPYQQNVPRSVHLVVKAAKDDAQLLGAVRRELLKADPELPLFDTRTMPERVSASLVNRRAAMVLCLVFGGMALALAAIGIYGVLAYAVTQRTREFGIRVALGAGAGDVLGMVVGQGLRLAAVGLAIGVAAAYALTRLITSMLYGVTPGDPLVFAAVTLVLAAVALVASLVPSLRALRIRPAVALRV